MNPTESSPVPVFRIIAALAAGAICLQMGFMPAPVQASSGETITTFTITGQVRDLDGTTVVADTSVTLWRLRPYLSLTVGRTLGPGDTIDVETTRTDGAGRFQFRGSYTSLPLWVEAQTTTGLVGIGSMAAQDHVREPVKTMDVVLRTSTTVTGRVVDEANGAIDGATVTLVRLIEPAISDPRQWWPPLTETDSEGRFSFSEVHAGVPHEIQVEAFGFEPAKMTVETTTPRTVATISMMAGGGGVEGRLLRAETGEPAALTTMSLRKQSPAGASDTRMPRWLRTTTDADGRFEYPYLAAGTYEVSLPGGDLDVVPMRGGLGPNTHDQPGLTIESGQTTTGVEIYAFAGYQLEGVVEDADGKPLAGVEVGHARGVSSRRSDKPGHLDTTGETGRFQIRVPHGSTWDYPEEAGRRMRAVDVVATKPGLLVRRETDPLTHSYVRSATRVRFEADQWRHQNLRFVMEEAPVIMGRVVTQQGLPVAGAKVVVHNEATFNLNSDDFVLTDSAGKFEVAVPPKIAAIVAAEHPDMGFAASDPLQTTDQATTVPDIALLPWGRISGVVVNHEDKPVPGASVRGDFRVDAGSRLFGVYIPAVETAEDGTFRLERAHPNRQLNITAAKADSPSGRTQAVVAPGGEKSDVRIVLPVGMAISGRVVDGTGKPLGGLDVSTWCDGGHANDTTTDRGTFELKPLAAGVCGVQVASRTGDQVMQVENVSVGTTDLEIVFDTAKDPSSTGGYLIKGRVVDDETEQPVTKGLEVLPGREVSQEKIRLIPNQPGHFEARVKYPYAWLLIRAADYAPLHSGQMDLPKDVREIERTFRLKKGRVLTGRIVDSATAPLSGVVVRLRQQNARGFERDTPPQGEMRTGPDGRFRFDKVASGKQVLDLSPPPPLLGMEHGGFMEEGQAETDFGDITVGEGATLQVRVTKGPQREPIPNVPATHTETPEHQHIPGKTQSTDLAGMTTFRGLKPGRHSIIISLPSGTRLTKTAEVEAGKPNLLEFNAGAGTLKVRLMRAGQPAPGEVSIRPFDSPDDLINQDVDSGSVEIQNLEPQRYVISGVLREQATGSYATRTEVREIRDGRNPEVLFEFPGGAISGVIVDEAGKPVTGTNANVWLIKQTGPEPADPRRMGPYVAPDATGRFAFATLEPGTYRAFGMDAERGSAVSDPIVLRGANQSVTGLRLVIRPSGGSLTLVAVDLETGRTIETVNCHLYRDGVLHWRRAAVSPVYEMTWRDLPPGKYFAELHAVGYTSQELEIEVKRGEATRLEVVLTPGAPVIWRVRAAGSIRMEDLRLTVTPDDPNSIQEPKQQTGVTTGYWFVGGLLPGDYTAQATLDGKVLATEKFVLRQGDSMELNTLLRDP